jgi:endo-alpha-1,4-polygalactosaminidase (GH114 family)
MTPWDRLEDWAMCDKSPKESTTEYITAELQERWPGNYRVAYVWNPKNRDHLYSMHYEIKFDTPAEETMFRLKWG